MKKSKMYIYDCLYGPIYLDDFVIKILSTPELQRLREVRLCNINSLSITGGANINRYEHSIGTCFLAKECIDSWARFDMIDSEERKAFILAGLLHDVANGPFGHSYEYIITKDGFSPEKGLDHAIKGSKEGVYKYKSITLEPIYFGMPRELGFRMTDEEIERVSQIVSGESKFGPLINGTLDLDNIDNVFRMAYHIGLVKSGDVPLKLAKSIRMKDNKLIIDTDAISCVEEWYNIREKLYRYLLLNPEEFSAKCMLTEAIDISKKKERDKFFWYDIDYELLLKLSHMPDVILNIKELLFKFDKSIIMSVSFSNLVPQLQSIFKGNNIELSNSCRLELKNNCYFINDKSIQYLIEERNDKFCVYKIITKDFNISKIVTRLMKGDLYSCIGIFSTSKIEKYCLFNNVDKRIEIENDVDRVIHNIGKRFNNIMIAFHPILDKNKTRRQVCFKTDENENIIIGESTRHLLIGAFIKNEDMSIYKITDKNQDFLSRIRNEIYNYLSVLLDDDLLSEIALYEEVQNNAF